MPKIPIHCICERWASVCRLHSVIVNFSDANAKDSDIFCDSDDNLLCIRGAGDTYFLGSGLPIEALGGAAGLAEQLQSSTTLTAVCLLGANKLKDEGCKALAEGIKRSTTIRDVALIDNRVFPDGCKALADSFNHNTSLRHVNLTKNHIGVDGCEALAESLRQGSTITKLVLHWNLLRDEGVQVLAECLEFNTTLEWIDLSCAHYWLHLLASLLNPHWLRGRRLQGDCRGPHDEYGLDHHAFVCQ
mmetsp:Transcript_16950/g.35916  ORF Transcript_16950/g.35916 Transcript_16950/m.35916 type:complete len:245 (+) Transcript_16950:251-985(+)